MGNIKEIMKKSIEYILLPIKRNLVFFFVYFILQILPIYKNFLVADIDKITLNIFVLFFSIFILSYLICTISELLGKINIKVKKVFNILIHIFLYSSAFVNLFCDRLLITNFNSLCISLIMETNSKEVSDFVNLYILNTRFMWIFIVLFVIAIFEIVLFKLVQQYPIFKKTITKITSVGFILIIGFSVFTYPLQKQNIFLSALKNNSFYRLYIAVSDYNLSKNVIPLSIENTRNIQLDSCNFSSPNIIMVIGESFNKHHSSLYGCVNETNPKLKSLIGNGLYVFNDVITTSNFTTTSFQNFLSLNSVDKGERWHEAPLFPAYLKKAGYNVAFVSNQFVKPTSENNVVNAIVDYYLQHPILDSCMFTYRNTEKFKRDMEFLDFYKKNRSTIEKDSLNFIIFHLLGQHMQYDKNLPDNFTHFTKDSIKRDDLLERQKQIVADYNNSVIHNDSIMVEFINLYKDKDAIIIYFADHGEEVYDFRAYFGRSFNIDGDKRVLYHQFEIPFMIYVSEIYRKNHPNIVNNIEQSLNKPFNIDDIPHLIFDLAGLKTSLFDTKRSIINSEYDIKDRYIVDYGFANSHNYDKIMKNNN